MLETQKQIQIPENNQESFVLMDLEDEGQIVSEMKGAVLDKFIYSFQQGAKKVVGLSFVGINQVCRESADKGEVFRVLEVIKESQDEKQWYVALKIGRYKLQKNEKTGEITGDILLDTTIGSANQSKKIFTKERGLVDDEFAYRKAYSKAERNGKRNLLPYALITTLIEKYIGTKHEQVIEADSQISEAQGKLLHATASKNGVTHERLKILLQKEFGYEHIEELRKSQVDKTLKLITENAQSLEIPQEIIKRCKAKGIMKAKGEALWLKALEVNDNDQKRAEDWLIYRFDDGQIK